MDSSPKEGARFSPRLTRSKDFCCAYGCFTQASKEPTIRFHRFPKPDEGFVDVINKFGVAEKVNKLSAWKLALKIEKEVSAYTRVCSLHFKKNDYILLDLTSQRRCLKKSAVPSCNLPKEQTTVDRRMINKSHRTKVHRQTATMEQSASFTLRSCIKTNRQLCTLTGIECFEIFNRIVNIVHSVNPEIVNTRSNLESSIMMTFVKLKQNSSYKTLGIMCGISSAQRCERIFNRMLEVLSKCLKPAIYWPTKTEICCNLPKSFKGFEGVRVVLGCTEIKIEKSKNLSCKVQTYSPYKNDYTLKFVSGFTPAGVVSFISEPYGGRMSHKGTFENCDLIKKLDRHVFMMTDKRFVGNELCKDKETKFIARINYVKGQKQVPTSYALVTSKDPKMGEFIETTNRRIKSFKILNDRLPAKLIEKSKYILTIICATVNLSSPVLKDYKFEL